jgi:hypothetical protein
MRMRWAEHVARLRELTNDYNILVVKPEGEDRLEDLGANG